MRGSLRSGLWLAGVAFLLGGALVFFRASRVTSVTSATTSEPLSTPGAPVPVPGLSEAAQFSRGPSAAPSPPALVTEATIRARAFTADFYAWYTEEPFNRGYDNVLRLKKASLTYELAEALTAYVEACSKMNDLDSISYCGFDLILNAQDVPLTSTFGDVVTRGGHMFVPVYGSWEGVDAQVRTKLDVTAELVCPPTGCQLVDFHYPGGSSLLAFARSVAAQAGNDDAGGSQQELQ